jgi:hypothetical protein
VHGCATGALDLLSQRTLERAWFNLPAVGIHPALRHPRPLPPRRLNRPPQTPFLHRRHRPRALPHTRCVLLTRGVQHLRRPLWLAFARRLHAENYVRRPRAGRQDRRLGNRLPRQIRRAVCRSRRQRRWARRCDERRARRVLVQGHRARAVSDSGRRARGTVAREAGTALLAAESHAFHV